MSADILTEPVLEQTRDLQSVATTAPKVFLGIPHYGDLKRGVLMAVLTASQRIIPHVCDEPASLLCYNFNRIFAEALNARKTLGINYFMMLHSDMVPDPWYVDTMLDEMQRVNADVLSIIAALKDPRGLVSTGWRPFGSLDTTRFTMTEIMRLPVTFDAAGCGHPKDMLMINTGLWIARLDHPWVDEFRGFTIRDGLWRDKNGMAHASVLSEDWNWSAWLAERRDVRVFASRCVRLGHEGPAHFYNDSPWGQWQSDKGDGPPEPDAISGPAIKDQLDSPSVSHVAPLTSKPKPDLPPDPFRIARFLDESDLKRGDYAFSLRAVYDRPSHKPQIEPLTPLEAVRWAASVPGWMHPAELLWLAEQAAKLPNGGSWLDVGIWSGRSFAAVALAATAGAAVAGVDNWLSMVEDRGNAGRGMLDPEVALHEWLKTQCAIKEIRPWLQAGFIRSSSVEEAAHTEDGGLDVVFIDGKHDFESVKEDVAAWLPKLKKNGMICGHDAQEPEVARALDEVLVPAGWPWSRAVYNSIWFSRRAETNGERGSEVVMDQPAAPSLITETSAKTEDKLIQLFRNDALFSEGKRSLTDVLLGRVTAWKRPDFIDQPRPFKTDEAVNWSASVPGCFHAIELAWLADRAGEIGRGGSCLVVGRWPYRPASAITLAIPTHCYVMVCDTAVNDSVPFQMADLDWPVERDRVLKALTRLRPRIATTFMEIESSVYAKQLETVSFDMALLDSVGDPLGLLKEIESWLSKMKPEGLLCGTNRSDPIVSAVLDKCFAGKMTVREGPGQLWFVKG